MLIDLENVAKQFGAEEIFFGVTATVVAGQRIGLIGSNGAGKTTLLEVITGKLEPDEGRASRSKGISIGYLRQDSGLDRTKTVMQEMRSVFSELLELEKTMKRLTKELEDEGLSPTEQEKLSREYATAHELFEVGEGYNIDVKIATVLTGMGFRGEATDKTIEYLSGGERTRLALCKLLLENPDLLILDEPTNHLDFRTLLWLEDYLSSYKGALLVVSHDRYFLDKLVGDIWEIENTRFYTYKGNYSKYVVLKEERVARQLKEYEIQQQEMAAMQDYVARNMARASTSNMAKSRLKALQRMGRIERPTLPPEAIKLSFESDREPVKDVLGISGLKLVVGEQEHVLAENLEFEVRRGEKIALVGANGAGKTTLLRVIQNMMPATGQVVWGRGVSLSYYDQGTDTLNQQNTLLEEIHSTFPKAYELTLRSMLGRVGLTGEDSFKLVSQLSGGECARLKFAVMMLKRGNVLILDEPTNHLDFASKEALDKALCEFEGTVIMVSHDRYLLDRVPDRIVELSQGELLSYKGKFSQYVEYANLKPQKEIATETKSKESTKAGGYNKGKEQRKLQAARKKALTDTETAIAQTEGIIARLEEELAAPEVQSDFVRLDEICAGLDDARTKLSLLMEDWVELSS